MAKPLEPFHPIAGDEPFEDRIAAFNRVGANIDRLHECVDDGFAEAKTSRDLIADQLDGHIQQSASHFLTIQDRLKGIDGRLQKVDVIASSVKVLTDHRDSEENRTKGIRKFLAAVLVATVASTAATLAGATFLFFTNAHNHETTHRDIADSTAEGYTADKAAKDRAEQERRDTVLVNALEDLNKKIGAVKHSAEHK